MFSSQELIKLKFHEVQNIVMEQEKTMKMEMEKKSVEMEEEIQKLRREKADVERKLEKYRTRCDNANQRVEELRRENQQLRVKMKMKESDKPRLSKKEKMKMKESDKPRLSKEDLPDFHENAGIGSSKKGFDYNTSVTRGCKLERIDVILDNLHKKNLERFEQSCFGHLLKISDYNLKYQGTLIMHLLLHMDKGASRKGRLVFTIQNSTMEFGLGEFCHITGLTDLGTSASASASAATSSSIYKDVFQSRPWILLKDIEEAFLKVCRDNGGQGELTLKLAFLYFLFGTLLGNHGRSATLKYLHLVDDLHNFNVFPWGRVAYELLFKSISAFCGRIDGAADTNRTLVTSNVSGFTFALQIWAYEVMPFVAAYCASRAHSFDKGTPPILHWHATKMVRFGDLKKFFTPGDESLVKIKPFSMPKEMDLSKKGGRRRRRLAHSVKTEDCSEPAAAAAAVMRDDNQGKEPEMRGCSRASAKCSDGEVKMRSGDDDRAIIISDSSDDEDYCVGKDSNSILDEEEDSDDDSCSDSYMNTLAATLQSRNKRQKKDL